MIIITHVLRVDEQEIFRTQRNSEFFCLFGGAKEKRKRDVLGPVIDVTILMSSNGRLRGFFKFF